jgi:hypothetical protein
MAIYGGQWRGLIGGWRNLNENTKEMANLFGGQHIVAGVA